MSLQMQLNQHVNKIILFGSVARGDDTSESDIDILIIVSSKSAVEKFIADTAYRLSWSCFCSFDEWGSL